MDATERKWLRDMQKLLNACPPRFGFYTVGDPGLTVFDREKEHLFDDTRDMPGEVTKHDADLASLNFTTNVHGVCG